MANVTTAPRIRCDNCGKVEEYDQRGACSSIQWTKPTKWGSVQVSPTQRGNYPNHIAMTDLCENCLIFVHDAVGDALKKGREE